MKRVLAHAATIGLAVTIAVNVLLAPVAARGFTAGGQAGACGLPRRARLSNGIGVGDPKVFDNRTLALMLDGLNDSLRTASVVDIKALAGSLGLLQGFQQSAVSRSFSLQGAPLPAVTSSLKDTLQGSSIAGGSASLSTATTPPSQTASATSSTSDTSSAAQERSVQTTTAARTPSSPDLPAMLAAPAFAPQFGASPTDLLTDQVNLQYQIFNLRMLLERSLSDRLIGDAPRLQAVLGFNISIDPPKGAEDSAAIVEITLEQPSGQAPVSVVALMPQEKTYNSAALSSSSTAFGGSAVAQILSIGYSERRQSETFYLYRDSDTTAFQRMTGAPNETRFGWTFRPVLGRRAVAPGTRQMFAVVSLPGEDVGIGKAIVAAKVRTYWRHYDRKSLTVSDQSKLPDSSAAGCVEVPTTSAFQGGLSPVVEGIDWRRTDDNQALVTVRGQNFFQGTLVRFGGTNYAAASDGLILKSDKAFDLLLPLQTLLAEGAIVGRYGNAVPLMRPPAGAPAVQGIVIRQVTTFPSIGGRIQTEIVLRGESGQPLRASDLPGPPIVEINGDILPSPYEITATSDGSLVVRVFPTNAQFPDRQGIVRVRFPFAGEPWQRSARAYEPTLALSVSRFASSDAVTTLLIETNDVDNPFTTAWKVSIGQSYDVQAIGPAPDVKGAGLRSPVIIEVHVAAGDVDKNPLILLEPSGTAHRLSIPPAKPKAESMTISGVEPAAVKLNDARKVTVNGQFLDRVARVTANGFTLDSRVIDARKLEVFLIRALTEKPGTVTLVCRDDKGAILGSVDLQIQ